nr:MAG TPA: hypothetical protein [Caudoviricetes sp.]
MTPGGLSFPKHPPPKSRPTFDLLRRCISIWVLACPSNLVLHACFLLLSGHALGQAKTQIEV